MTIIIQSHNYTINLDNVSYFRSEEYDQTIFTMNNGHKVRITCPYGEVLKQIKNKAMRDKMNLGEFAKIDVFELKDKS